MTQSNPECARLFTRKFGWSKRVLSRVEFETPLLNVIFFLDEWSASSSLGFYTQAKVGREISRLNPSEFKLVLYGKKELNVRSVSLDAGQEIGFYTCERISVVRDRLIAIDLSGGRLVPPMQALSNLLHVILSFPCDQIELMPCKILG